MAPQDTYLDDEEETCPLCIEEFDLSDKNFRPCPCGYQVCQFCFHNIKSNMNGLCPACRRPYDEKTIQYKAVTAEEQAEFRANLQKSRKKRAELQGQREVQKRESEKDARKNLVGIRVVQKNLVYVTGLTPTVKEDELLKTLRRPEFFGQYGNIQKISISNRKNQEGQNQSLGIYVTFEKKEDAQRCIQAVNGSQNGDRILKAQLGTTKYCSAWLRHEQCTNRQCMFLHELGEEEDSYTRQDLSSLNSMQTHRTGGNAGPSSRSASRQQGAQPQAQVQSQSYLPSQPMARTSSKEGSDAGEGPALPASANWARNPQQRSRRGSHATSGAASSPAVSMSLPVTTEATEEAVEVLPQEEAPGPEEAPPAEIATNTAALEAPKPEQHPADIALREMLRILGAGELRLRPISPDNSCPPLFDPRGGEKRRAMREEEERRLDGEQDEQGEPMDLSEGEPESGSLALGGEPEDRDHGREVQAFEQRRVIAQPPISRSSTDGLYGPGIASGFSQQGAPGVAAALGNRTLTPQQQAYLRPQRSFTDSLPPGITPSPSSLFQGQGHSRQTSRFNFGSDTQTSAANTLKMATNPRLMAQQASNPAFHSQPTGPYYSSMPGPPPGLKSTGTPPNMFGQGGSFGNSGFGAKDNNEVLQNLIRGRTAGVGQAHDASKREFMFPTFPYHQYPPSTSSTPAPATAGLMAALYPNGAHQDIGAKQKKKGKKHRHANTSSSGGGGLVDLADPSILQARIQHHQQSNAGVGSAGLFGGQASGGYNPNVLYNNTTQYRGW
ncbi:hypothetical protein M406DRAFT_266556 [Cryphonectria parasitica EP155]|uniref:General negative regulator of transcription subunit 4 n=1 Tax=Cryphonectria parasitica (strain ATCC 38755 / EP155) TaxID=660469 RepID=A0A9P5CKB1_CRYP1|nr:uncharacterized protein M406DRAFT_266556 [Cryphonectria parasitica EP155]KAF3761868.1 hypothetical protein M406DRAFT_266556 [Cryphonectria parasitica EP155]